MPPIRRLPIVVACAATLSLVVALSPTGADEPNPKPGPNLGPEATATLAWADGLDQRVLELHAEGKYAEAISVAREAVAVRERVLGKMDPSLSTSLNNLAVLLHAGNVLPEARALFERVVALREREVGREHPDVAPCLHNLATVLRDTGAHAQALAHFERALALREKGLGTDHPETAQSLVRQRHISECPRAAVDGGQVHARFLQPFPLGLGV